MHGVVAAGHPQTAEAGAEILRQGGNAVDAAVAATFVTFIAESSLVNIGGGGIANIYNPATGQATTYDFFSNMPGLSTNGDTPTTDIDFRKIMVDFGAALQPFYIGRGSVAVPGVVAGLCKILDDAGTLPLQTILAPAIKLARRGVVLSAAQHYIVHLLAPILTDTPKLADIYAPGGQVVEAGQKLYFPRLANTLEQLGQQGASLFYSGDVARKIVIDQQTKGGLLTAADLENYQVHCQPPISINYKNYTILLPPPSSGGGALIAFALKLLGAVSLSGVTHNSVKHLKILTEVMRQTSSARAAWERKIEQSGPRANGHVNDLLADTHLAGYQKKLLDILAGKEAAEATISRKGPSNTTHISVADANGMVAGITTSAGENAGFVVDDTGVSLNNMLGEIDLHRNGFHQLPPGQRLITMMSPVIVLKQGRPILVIGSGGSNRIRSAILQVISNVLDFNMPPAEAVDAPRLHFEDNQMQLEGGISAETAEKMVSAGYNVNCWPKRNMFFGGAHAVARETPQSRRWVAAGDSRRGGSVVVVEQ